MSNRPQTLYGIADSPVGLAAWMIDHDIRSYLMIARAFSGKTEGLTPDDILENVTLYWLTNTAISSARLYWDTTQVSTGGGFFDVRGVKIPVAVSVFPDEIYRPRRVGQSGRIPSSSTTTSSIKAVTLPLGSSRSCSARDSNLVPVAACIARTDLPQRIRRRSLKEAGHD